MSRAVTWTLGTALAVSSAAVGFAVFTPVSVLSDLPAKQIEQQGGTLDVNASLGRGSAYFESLLPTGAQQIDWWIDGISIAPAGIAYDLRLAGPLVGDARVIGSPLGPVAVIENGRFRSSAKLFAGGSQRVEGQITIGLTRAEIAIPGGQLTDLSGQIQWQNAGVALEEQIALGTIHGALSATPQGGVRMVVSNAGVEVSVSGTITFEANWSTALLDLVVRPGTNASPTLLAILESWGTSDDGNAFAIRRQIALP
jgi:hypothetical protein